MSTDTSVYKLSSPADRGNVFTPVTDPCTVRVAAYAEHAEIGGQCIAFVVMPCEDKRNGYNLFLFDFPVVVEGASVIGRFFFKKNPFTGTH